MQSLVRSVALENRPDSPSVGFLYPFILSAVSSESDTGKPWSGQPHSTKSLKSQHQLTMLVMLCLTRSQAVTCNSWLAESHRSAGSTGLASGFLAESCRLLPSLGLSHAITGQVTPGNKLCKLCRTFSCSQLTNTTQVHSTQHVHLCIQCHALNNMIAAPHPRQHKCGFPQPCRLAHSLDHKLAVAAEMSRPDCSALQPWHESCLSRCPRLPCVCGRHVLSYLFPYSDSCLCTSQHVLCSQTCAKQRKLLEAAVVLLRAWRCMHRCTCCVECSCVVLRLDNHWPSMAVSSVSAWAGASLAHATQESIVEHNTD